MRNHLNQWQVKQNVRKMQFLALIRNGIIKQIGSTISSSIKMDLNSILRKKNLSAYVVM